MKHVVLSEHALATRKEYVSKTGRPLWRTSYMGSSWRSAEGNPEILPDVVYPVAFLVEQAAGTIVRPHYHTAAQFQVFVEGSGKIGRHALDGVTVHYANAYTTYGPIECGEKGLSYFTLRNGWDLGPQYMPDERERLKQQENRQHRAAVSAEFHALDESDRKTLRSVETHPLLEKAADGLNASWHRLPPGETVTGEDPDNGNGQYWLVVSGTALIGGTILAPRSCIFLASPEPPIKLTAGEGGAEILALQFPKAPSKH